MERLSDRYQVLAADLYGYGRSPAWNGDRALSLEDEVALIEPLLRHAGGPVHLIGHSYGAAVALRVALRHPQQVRSLSVYEPVLFSLLSTQGYRHPAAKEIQEIRCQIDAALRRRKAERAARVFVDYWSGAGSFAALAAATRDKIAAAMDKVQLNFGTADVDSVPLSTYRGIQIPTLYLHGAHSPWSTRQIAALLGFSLPRADVCILEGLGHMGPLTHPERVNGLIEGFLQHVDTQAIADAAAAQPESRVA